MIAPSRKEFESLEWLVWSSFCLSLLGLAIAIAAYARTV